MQFDTRPQSPQPSQTSALMKVRIVGVRPFAALAQAPPLGRAGLVVEDHGHALVFAEFALDRVHVVAVTKRSRPPAERTPK